MFYLKLIRYFFFFITLLVIITPVSYSFWDFFPALIFLWTIYFFFSIARFHGQNASVDNSILFSDKNISLVNNKRNIVLSTIFSIIFIPLYAKFYTGTSVLEGFWLFISGAATGGDSTYSLYQQHFSESGLGVFSIRKLPFIIGNGILKFIFWATVIRVVGFTRRILSIEVICLFIFFTMYFLLGVTRGTSFENFELLFILIFSVLLRFKTLYSSNWIKGKAKVIIYSLVCLAGFYFVYSKALRYNGDISFIADSGTSLMFDSEHFISKYFSILAITTSHLSGYFLFGMYVISNALHETLLNGTFEGILASILPFGLQVTSYGESYRSLLCGKIIDCGSSWIPDSLVLLQNLGLPIFLLTIYILGNKAYRSYIQAINGSLWHAILLYLILFSMFSLPIGNFITAASANIIAIMILLLFKFKPLHSKFFINNFNVIENEKNIDL